MQYYACGLAWWFNVGVQIFLCLSGYLYGRKEILDALDFLKKQFMKILVPYYLVIVLVIIVQLIFVRNEISILHIAKALLVYGTLQGGEHLWFIPTILFCYILTPLINEVNNRIFKSKQPLIHILLAFILISVVVKLFVGYFNPAWVVCFYIGHILGKNSINSKINTIVCKALVYTVAICLVSIQIIVSYILKIEMTGHINSIYNIMCDYGHVFFGISIVLIFLDIFKHIRVPAFAWKPISFLDSISYEGYLVHQFFILGTFSLLNFIDLPVIAVIAIFTVTFVLGSALKFVSGKIKQTIS